MSNDDIKQELHEIARFLDEILAKLEELQASGLTRSDWWRSPKAQGTRTDAWLN